MNTHRHNNTHSRSQASLPAQSLTSAAADTLQTQGPQLLSFCASLSLVQRLSSNSAAGTSGKLSSVDRMSPSAAFAGSQQASRADNTPTQQLGFVARRQAALASVPTLPKVPSFFRACKGIDLLSLFRLFA